MPRYNKIVIEDEKNWIADAIQKPGSLKATAKSQGALKDDGTINKKWLKDKAEGSSKTAKRARLAITLNKMKNESVIDILLSDSRFTNR